MVQLHPAFNSTGRGTIAGLQQPSGISTDKSLRLVNFVGHEVVVVVVVAGVVALVVA